MSKIRDVMTDEVVYLLPEGTVRQAAHLMQTLNVGIIPICNQQQHLLGVVTDRDIVLRVVALGKDPDTTTLIEIATKEVITTQPDSDIAEGVALMSQHQIRRLPVVDGQQLVGLVSIGDIAVHAEAKYASSALEEISQPALLRMVGSRRGAS